MREIKFRAWDTIHGKMSNNFTLIDCIEQTQAFALPENFIFMQYTGLKDKNGVEIYEGDVVVAQDHGKLDIGEWAGEVRMGNFNGAWCLYKTVDVSAAQDGSATQEQGIPMLNFINFMTGLVPEYEFEVIGNIYENPELLQNGKAS